MVSSWEWYIYWPTSHVLPQDCTGRKDIRISRKDLCNVRSTCCENHEKDGLTKDGPINWNTNSYLYAKKLMKQVLSINSIQCLKITHKCLHCCNSFTKTMGRSWKARVNNNRKRKHSNATLNIHRVLVFYLAVKCFKELLCKMSHSKEI